jgi:hypothetical protein
MTRKQDKVRYLGGCWDLRSDPRVLLHAVLLVKQMVEQPGSDDWECNRAFFLTHAKPSIVEMWHKETGEPREFFPWTDDHLQYTWIATRKQYVASQAIWQELLKQREQTDADAQ